MWVGRLQNASGVGDAGGPFPTEPS